MPDKAKEVVVKNDRFPGRPNYVGPTWGWFALLHHDELYEWSDNVRERIRYVRDNKPQREISARLSNMLYLGPLADTAAKCKDLAYECWKKIENQGDEGFCANRSAFLAEYANKCKPLDDAILAYILSQIPDCPWNGHELVFS